MSLDQTGVNSNGDTNMPTDKSETHNERNEI